MADRSTRSARIYEDTAEKLGWILRLENKGETAAEFIEELIRVEVENRFAPLSKRVEAIKAAEAGDDLPELANELGEAGA